MSERLQQQMERWRVIGELRKQNITFYNTANFLQIVNEMVQARLKDQ